MKHEPGNLYLVGTPIGNLEDISLRALRILKEADLVAAEDTRHTLKLLNHFEINKPLLSFNKDNWRQRMPQLLEHLTAGKNIALVTDAGMPGISDPGAEIVFPAREAGIKVIPVPGASALITALAASGLSTQKFVFYGFLARSGKEREKQLAKIMAADCTVVFYEAPGRIISTLADLLRCGGRKIVLARELTKIHEEFLVGTAEELLAQCRGSEPRGEYTVLVEGRIVEENRNCLSRENAIILVNDLMARGVKMTEAVKIAADESGIDRRTLYREITGKRSE